MTTQLTKKDSRKEQAPRAQGSPASGEPSETANVHIEHYFPKGYDPDAEPWKSIKSHHYASLAATQAPRGQQQELLPCPFCGSENVSVEPLVGGFVVDCKDCGGGCGTCHSEDAACEEWNKRKSLTSILKERGIDSDKVESEIRARIQRSEPPRGQQQEWEALQRNGESWMNFRDSDGRWQQLVDVITDDADQRIFSTFKVLEQTHNAELASERDNYALALQMKNIETKRANDAEKTASDVHRVCDQLASNLTTERQHREQSDKAWAETNEKLSTMHLSALAAIEKLPERYAEHLSAAATAGELGDVDEKYQVDLLRSVISDIDLSALHEHDAKVREPLVEALELARDGLDEAWQEYYPSKVKQIDDALAKVKDQ